MDVYEGVPVIKEWRVLRFRIEERPPIWREAANVLNKESRTTEKGWSSISCFVRVAKNSIETYLDTNVHTEIFGPGLIIWYELSKGKVTLDFIRNKE